MFFYLWSCNRCLILPLVLLEMFNLPSALLQMFCLPWTLFFTFGLVKMLFTVGLVIDVFYL